MPLLLLALGPRKVTAPFKETKIFTGKLSSFPLQGYFCHDPQIPDQFQE